MRKSHVIATLALALGGLAASAQAAGITTESLDNMTISRPEAVAGKLPVVFLAHNGGAKKEDWGDFPRELASKGFFVVNIGWTNFSGGSDLADAMKKAVERYPTSIDVEKAALIGGCHGCVKFLSIDSPEMPVRVKALVLISMSEVCYAPDGHAPILGIYSTSDRLGGNYVRTQKSVYESILSEPKTVIALDAAPHGNELATDDSTKAQVREKVEAFLSRYLK